eukprot:3903305-Amphidinium_carterae.1
MCNHIGNIGNNKLHLRSQIVIETPLVPPRGEGEVYDWDHDKYGIDDRFLSCPMIMTTSLGLWVHYVVG